MHKILNHTSMYILKSKFFFTCFDTFTYTIIKRIEIAMDLSPICFLSVSKRT